MWRNIKIENVRIERLVGDYFVWMIDILPYAKMKIRVYENASGQFRGLTDLCVKRKHNGKFESASGKGSTIEEVIINTIKNFETILEEENIKSLEPQDIDYLNWTDF
ncbi:hypothetical protein [Snodgrassella communis]|uniref:hypothetical protein n=1 Tax=Snodgrassella communis TaxID=2946699 RepID=UPI001EF6D2C1|nr:hypothetical protein [Snodgrassella communis]